MFHTMRDLTTKITTMEVWVQDTDHVRVRKRERRMTDRQTERRRQRDREGAGEAF